MSALAIDPITDPSAWDVVLFSGIGYPYCDVSGFDRENEWDVKAGKGAYGATTTFTQLPPVKGTVKFLAWEKDHFTNFSNILAMLKYDPIKKTSQALSIWHPAIAEVDVDSVVATKISPWKHEGLGLYTREVDFLEYRPAPKVNATATPANASTANPNGTPGLQPNPAIKAAQDEYAEALASAKALPPLGS